jgi:hypothetical protein
VDDKGLKDDKQASLCRKVIRCVCYRALSFGLGRLIRITEVP